MSIESPPRLKNHAQLGGVMRAADQANLTPERIASNGDAIKATIAAGARTLSFWKILVPILLVGGGAYIAQRQLRSEPPAPPPPAVSPSVAAVSIEDAGVAFDAETVTVIETDAAVLAVVAKPKVRHQVPSDAGVASVTEDAADVAPTAVAPAPTSELPEQIELYEAARAAGARGAFADGLTKLDDLLQRFPQTPLRPDAELTRADLLSRAGRLDDAALALDALASSPAHRGRRGELLRTLGDVHRQRKDCKAAMEAYTLAQTVTLGTAEKAKVARGIEACAPPR